MQQVPYFDHGNRSYEGDVCEDGLLRTASTVDAQHSNCDVVSGLIIIVSLKVTGINQRNNSKKCLDSYNINCTARFEIQ